MHLRQRHTALLTFCCLSLAVASILLPNIAVAGQTVLAGYWDTRMQAGQAGTIKLMAFSASPVDGLEIGFGGVSAQVGLKDDGTGGDLVAGDGLYGLAVPLTPESAARYPVELFSVIGGQRSLSWPYLMVSEAPRTPTATATPTPTKTPTDPGTPTPTPTVWPYPSYDCNPLSVGKCLMPWPSSVFLRPDATTDTGVRVSVPDEALPGVNTAGRLNTFDGFSPANGLLVEFTGKLATTDLPEFEDVAAVLANGSRFLLFNNDPASDDYGTQIPMHVEVFDNGTNSVLVLRPARPLLPGSQYVAAVRGVYAASGGLAPSGPLFVQLRDGNGSGADYAALSPRYEELFLFLEDQGVTRDDLQIAWEFRTASTRSLTGPMVGMLDKALEAANLGSPTWRVISVSNVTNQSGSTTFGKYYQCSMSGPNFIRADQTYEFGPDGLPKIQGNVDFTFTIFVPENRYLASQVNPVPGVFFGHGIFGDAGQVANDHVLTLGYVGFAVDLQGFTLNDVLGLAFDVFPEPVSKLPKLTDRLQQSLVNAVILSESLRPIAGYLEEQHGRPILDTSRYYLVGQSLGGILCGVLTAIQPRLEASALIVPGSAWSHLMQRSSIWNTGVGFITFGSYFQALYPDVLEQQICLNLLQNVWDPVDPITYARHWALEPLGNRQPRHVLLQYGVPDATIPNFSTEMMIRAAGMPLLEPAAVNPGALETASCPTGGANYGGAFQYPGADHAAGLEDAALEQKFAFFRSFDVPNGSYGPPGNIQNYLP